MEDSALNRPSIRDVSGMNEFYHLMESHLQKHNEMPGWVLLALVIGVNDVAKKLSDSLNTTSIICGLLLSAELGQLIAPPVHIQNVDNKAFASYGFVVFLSAASILHFSVIVLNSLVINLLNTAARQADLLKIMYHIHLLPTICYIAFTVGNILLAASIGISVSVLYSGAAGWTLFMGFCFLGGGFMHTFNTCVLLKYGHVVHGWKQKDLRVLDRIRQDLERMAKLDRENFIDAFEK
ncbi:hypothetical protein HDU98_010791 [Podochytrium sp. JEL0797]|nr:hypothetical protein HDU98_010791 [Podochytrium sp. JEL0797]